MQLGLEESIKDIAHDIRLTQAEKEVKDLIEAESPSAPIYRVYQAFRSHIEGDLDKKNKILARRVCEFFIKSPEKWSAQDHYEPKRNSPIYLLAVDPSKLLVFGTDFMSAKQIKKKMQKIGLFFKVEITRVDNSHHLMNFQRSNEALAFIQTAASDRNSAFIERDSQSNAMTNEMTLRSWFSLWEYEYYNKQRNLQIRFCLKGQNFAQVKQNNRYQNAKKEMLEQFATFCFDESGLRENQAAISHGEGYWQKRKQSQNQLKRPRETERNNRSYILEPDRSRQKKIQPRNRLSVTQNIPSNDLNSSFGSDGDMYKFIDRKLQNIQKRNQSFRAKEREQKIKNNQSFESFCLKDIRNELSIIDSKKDSQKQESFDALLNREEQVQLSKQKIEKKKTIKKQKKTKDKNRLDMSDLCLDDLSEYDNSSSSEQKPQEDEDYSDISIINQKSVIGEGNNQPKTKEIDLSNLDIEQEQYYLQNNVILHNLPPDNFSKRLQRFSQAKEDRMLYQRPIRECELNGKNRKTEKAVHSNFSYRNYFQKTVKARPAAKKKVEVILDLTEQ